MIKQGENDAEREAWACTYAQRFLSMLDALMARLGMKHEPVLVGELGEFLAQFNRQPTFDWILMPHYQLVNEQLHALEAMRDNIVCVQARDLPCKEDCVHFSTEGLRILGQRYASAYLGYVNRCKEGSACDI